MCVGVVRVAVVDEVITDPSLFLSSPANQGQFCKSSTPPLHVLLAWFLLLIFVLTLLLLFSSWRTAVCECGSVFKLYISMEGEQHYSHQCDPSHRKHH